MKIKTKVSAFELKSIHETGEFTGYGAVFNNVDWYRDVIVKGAFEETISGKSKLPMLWQHDGSSPIGIISGMSEDNHGLLIEAKLALGTQRGKEAHELLKMGAVEGLSIGYTVPDGGSEIDKEKNINKLLKLDLKEISIVTFPANELALVSEVKNIFKDGGTPTERQLEAILRDIGLSKSQSKAFIAKGYSGIHREDEESESEEVINLLKDLTLTLKGVS